MIKKLFFILFSGFISIAVNPEILSASDSVMVTGLNNAGIVETVPLPEPEPAPVVATYTPAPYVAPAPAPLLNYTVTQVTGAFVTSPSYYDIYRTNSLIYAHNSAGLMGSLLNLGVGSVFNITEGGVARTFRVNDLRIFVLDDARTHLTDTGSGVTYTMRDGMISGANGHQVALMTCYGAYDPVINTARYRYIVYADAI